MQQRSEGEGMSGREVSYGRRIEGGGVAMAQQAQDGIYSRLDRLEKALTAAHEISERLEAQLGTVLQPAPPLDRPQQSLNVASAVIGDADVSPMAHRVTNSACSAAALCDRLNALLHRVDV